MQQIFAKATGREIHEHLFARGSANDDNRLRVHRVKGTPAPGDPTTPPAPPIHGSLPVVEGQSTIIGRRDVAIVPWVTIAMCAVAVAVSV